jgi:hypothetical protein
MSTMGEKSVVNIVKLFKEDGKSYFHACSTWTTSEDDQFCRLELLFVDVDDNLGFRATFDKTALQKMRETTRSDDIDDWAKSAFTVSSTDFRCRSNFKFSKYCRIKFLAVGFGIF